MSRVTAAVAVLVALTGLAVAAPPVPTATCSWHAYAPTPINAGYCEVGQNFYIAVSDEPTTYIGKALTRVYGRAYLCGQLASADACNAKAAQLGCSWSAADKACTSAELSQWTWYRSHTYLQEAPAWAWCPGSQARANYECPRVQGAKACAATKGCVATTSSTGVATCAPAFSQGWSDAQLSAWFDKVSKYDPSVVGSCAGVCYLRRMNSCQTLGAGLKADAAQKACAARSYCRWSNGVCAAGLYGNDAWGKAVTSAQGTCTGLSKDSVTCGKGPVGAVLQFDRIKKYVNYPSAAEAAAPVQCSL